MKVLFTIPHYYNADAPNTRYASYRTEKKEEKIRALEQVISNIDLLFGKNYYGALHHKTELEKLNNPFQFDYDIIICTSHSKHLLNELQVPVKKYSLFNSEVDPLALGFACHFAMRQLKGKYDYYCYLEDDIVIHDQMFFNKLEFFNSKTPVGHLLQPQRYERIQRGVPAPHRFISKLYPDFMIKEAESNCLSYDFELLGNRIKLDEANHPHSGCFFVNHDQFEILEQSEFFAKTALIDRSMALDQAATLALTNSFLIFKPAKENINFFEVEHAVPGMMDQIVFDADNNPTWRWDSNTFKK